MSGRAFWRAGMYGGILRMENILSPKWSPDQGFLRVLLFLQVRSGWEDMILPAISSWQHNNIAIPMPMIFDRSRWIPQPDPYIGRHALSGTSTSVCWVAT